MDYCLSKNNTIEPSTKHIKAEMLGNEITKNIQSVMQELPNELNKHNLCLFVTACEKIEKICSDVFNDAERLGVRDVFSCWRKLLIPFWKFGGVWENAYGEGFSWKLFLETILEEECCNVNCFIDEKNPELLFFKNGILGFTITVVDED